MKKHTISPSEDGILPPSQDVILDGIVEAVDLLISCKILYSIDPNAKYPPNIEGAKRILKQALEKL